MSMFDDYIEHSSAPSSSRPPPISQSSYTNTGAGFQTGVTSPTGYEIASGGVDLSGVEGYEGFEKDPGDEVVVGEEGDELREREGRLEALDSFHLPLASTSRSQSNPIFSLSPVQFSFPNRLLCLSVNANILIMGIYPLSVLMIDLERPGEVINVDLPKPTESKDKEEVARSKKAQIDKVYGDPTGRHLIITATNGDTFYLSTAGLGTTSSDGTVPPRKARHLRLRHPITCLAWPTPKSSLLVNPSTLSSIPLATECLLGGPAGQITTLSLPPSEDLFNIKGVAGLTGKTFERDHVQLYALPDGAPIDGLAFGYVKPDSDKSGKGRAEKKVWMLATTKDRMYEFQCGAGVGSMLTKGGWSEEMIRKYKEGVPKFQEISGDIEKGLFRVWTGIFPTDRKGKRSATVGAWLSASGLYHSIIHSYYPTSITGPLDIFPSPTLLPYPPTSNPAHMLSKSANEPEKPMALLLTEWHFVFLYAGGKMVAVSRLTEKVVWEERLPLRSDEKAIGVSGDILNKTFWVHTDKSLYEVVTREEDRDVWRAKLEKELFEESLRYAKTPRQLDIIRCRQADHFFDSGRFMQAAQTYAMSSRSFEFVTLRFIDADEKDALRVYLSERLDQLDKGELTQRMMLATWLVEIYLSKLNTLEDIIAAEAATTVVDDMKTELKLMEEDTRTFMTTYQANLDKKVMYELLQSHGRVDLYLFFAGLLKDWDLVAEHWINEEKWLQAIDVINRQDSVELYYRFSALLMWNVPQETVDSWLRQPALDTRRLIPALLVHKQSDQLDSSMRQAIRYLKAIIDRGSTDVTIHNLLITVLVKDAKADDASLLQFLSSCVDDPITGLPYYDLDYALRLCKQNNRIQPCVHIYSKMGLYESSVDLALEKGDLELARLNADKPEDDDILRKKLWLKIAKYVVQEKHDIKSAIHFLELTDLLKIEDILPFFPDFVIIDDFKDEICSALEDYSAHIASLKAEMDEATRSAESIKQDIANLKNRFIAVDANERCTHCSQMLLTRQFYVFPCQHVFHADCLITLAKDYLPSPSLRRIIALQNELIKLTSAHNARTLLSSQPDDALLSSRKNLFGSSLTSALAAGDKLRDLIVPDVLANAVSVIGSAGGVGGKKKNGAVNGKGAAGFGEKERKRVEKLREELDGLLAGSCVLCEGSVQTLDKPFITAIDDDGSWDI